jgi:hypothetical protein
MTNDLRFRKEFQLQPRQMIEADVREKAEYAARPKAFDAWMRLRFGRKTIPDKQSPPPESPASGSSD